MVEFFAKGWVFEPATEGALGYAGVSGGLGQGLSEGNLGEGGPLAEDEFGNFDFPAIVGQLGWEISIFRPSSAISGRSGLVGGFGLKSGLRLLILERGIFSWFSGIKHRVASVAL